MHACIGKCTHAFILDIYIKIYIYILIYMYVYNLEFNVDICINGV